QIRGLGPITLSVRDPRPTLALLFEGLGMALARSYRSGGDEVLVASMGTGGAAAELHLAVQPDLPPARPGAGGVHHVAFRASDDDHLRWLDHLEALRIPNSGSVDRFYFRSLYFREPNGILFEIATDGPGFDVDEPLGTLGEELALPPFLEPRRADIEANLRPLA
ncbi:MAG: VOC family protein, partial [Deinococcales bacterium]